MKNKGLIIAIVVTVLIAGALVYFRNSLSGPRSQVALKDQTSTTSLPKVGEQDLTPGSNKPEASVVLHVNNPSALREHLKANPWLQDVLGSPLGRGFGAGWTGFLQTKGEELKARFTGPVLDYLADKAFGQPFAIAWVSDSDATGVPAFIIDSPKNDVFETMNALAARGIFNAKNCPGESAGSDVKFKIVRWLVADQAMYGAQANGRLVVASKPTTVLQGLCIAKEAIRPTKPALDLAIYPSRFGRESQLFGVLLGTKDDIHMPLEIENGRIVPKGITADLDGSRLAVAAPSDELLKLIPEDMPVVAVLNLKLPKTLTNDSLAAYFKDGKGETVVRQAALLWDPKGKNDIALAWSVPGEQDALKAIFNDTSLNWRSACGHVLMASGPDYGSRIERSCKGQSPSRANAAPEIVAGVKAQQSIALQLNLGTLMSTLMVDQYTAEKGAKTAMPPEIEQAKKQLEALPFMGFRGRADGNTLVGEGFRS